MIFPFGFVLLFVLALIECWILRIYMVRLVIFWFKLKTGRLFTELGRVGYEEPVELEIYVEDVPDA